jgi:hypothetical protein
MEVFVVLRIGRALAVVLVVVVVGLVGAASAFASPLWLVKGAVLKASEAISAPVKFGVLKFKWEEKTSGTKFEAECKRASGRMELDGGGPGKDKVRSLSFKECTLTKGGTECGLTIGGVTAEGLPGWATELQESGGKFYDLASEVKFSLILEGCETVSFNKTWLFKGNLEAEASTSSEKVKLVWPTSELSGDTLESEGAKAQLSGEGEVEVEGGSLKVMGEESKSEFGTRWYENGISVPIGTSLEALAAIVSGSKYSLKSTLAGVKIKIECSRQDSTGKIENKEDPGGEILGIGLSTTLFDSCEVPEPAGQECKIDEPIDFKINSKLIKISGETWDEFSPDPEGGAFVEITFTGCKTAALDTTAPVDGTADGLLENSNETTKFKGGTNESLTFGGNTATFSGESKTMLNSGGVLEGK